eukprot:gene36343-44835_t
MTLVGPQVASPFNPRNQNLTLIEITPLYIGQFKSHDVRYNYMDDTDVKRHKTMRVGGAIEPFAFSHLGHAPREGLAEGQINGTLSVPPPDTVFDLQYATAATGWAPALLFDSFDRTVDKGDLPFDYWSPADPTPHAVPTDFADGGVYENIPLISFLQRRVPKIILFINGDTPLQPSYNPEFDAYDGQIDSTLASFFGVNPDPNTFIEWLVGGIISTRNLTTIENERWGIPAGINVTLSINYLGRLKNWESALCADMKAQVQPKTASDLGSVKNSDCQSVSQAFSKFPNYRTTAGTIKAEEANVLAYLTGWSVLQNKALYRQLLS